MFEHETRLSSSTHTIHKTGLENSHPPQHLQHRAPFPHLFMLITTLSRTKIPSLVPQIYNMPYQHCIGVSRRRYVEAAEGGIRLNCRQK